MPEEPKANGLNYTETELQAIDYLRKARQTGEYDPEVYQTSVDLLFPKTKDGRQATLKNTWALAYGPDRAGQIVGKAQYASQLDPTSSITLQLPNEGTLLNESGGVSAEWANKASRAKNTFIPKGEESRIILASSKFDPFDFIGSHELGHWQNYLGSQKGDTFDVRPDLRLDPNKVDIPPNIKQDLVTRTRNMTEEDVGDYFWNIFKSQGIQAKTQQEGVQKLLDKTGKKNLVELLKDPKTKDIIIKPIVETSGIHGKNAEDALANSVVGYREIRNILNQKEYDDYRGLTNKQDNLNSQEQSRLSGYQSRLEKSLPFAPERYDRTYNRNVGYGQIPEEFTADTLAMVQGLSAQYGIDPGDAEGNITKQSLKGFLDQVQQKAKDSGGGLLSQFPRFRMLYQLAGEEGDSGNWVRDKMHNVLQKYSEVKGSQSNSNMA